MVFKKYLLFISIISILFSCKRADDAWNEIRVRNATNDTIVLNFKRVGGTPEGFGQEINPNGNLLYANAIYTSDYGIIKDNWGREGDTIAISINNKIIKKWGAPLRSLPDSIHDFYNENSWAITKGGRKDKFIIATFTINENDLKQR